MSKPSINKTDVSNAIQTLKAEQRKITNRNIRDVLGAGSFNTIAKYRNELGYKYMETQPENIQPRPMSRKPTMLEMIEQAHKMIEKLQSEVTELKKA